MIPVRGERPHVEYPTRLRPPTLTLPRQRYSMTPLSSRAGPDLDLHRSSQRRVLRTFDTRAARLEMLASEYYLVPGLLVPPQYHLSPFGDSKLTCAACAVVATGRAAALRTCAVEALAEPTATPVSAAATVPTTAACRSPFRNLPGPIL